MKNAAMQSNKQYTAYISDRIHQFLSEIENTFFQIYTESTDTKYVLPALPEVIEMGYSTDSIDYFIQKDAMRNYFSFIHSQREEIVKVAIFDKQNKPFDFWARDLIYSQIKIDPSMPSFDDVFSSEDNRSRFFTYYEPVLRSYVMVFGRNIYDIFKRRKTGVVLFYIDLNYLQKIYGEYRQSNDYIIIVNDEKEAIYHTNRAKINDAIDDSLIHAINTAYTTFYDIIGTYNHQLVSSLPLQIGDLRLLSVDPLDELNYSNRYAVIVTVITISALFFVSLLLSAYFSHTISKPIKNLCHVMRSMEFDMKTTMPEDKRTDEVSTLNRAYNYMIERIQDMIQIQYKLEIKNKEAQLMALQSQINPHFLYNALQTIGGKAILNNSYEINSMCRALSDVFRYNIKAANNETTLSEELMHIENYLYIQKIRFQNIIEHHIEMDHSLGGCFILPLLMQPIVENSIVHCVEKSTMAKLIIVIQITREINKVIITIEDSGPGIDKAILAKIQHKLKSEQWHSSSDTDATQGIGIQNVHHRLNLFYGREYGLELSSPTTGGTLVRLSIPYRIKEQTKCIG
jgi:sensor histidine kinase YesM